jgi:hypothetical protein
MPITIEIENVTKAPIPLIRALCLHPFDFSLAHLINIPDWERVKDTNTPTAYIGNIRCVSALYLITKNVAAIERSIIPLEKLNLSPRFVNCLGAYPSLAINESRIGKSENAVLAAKVKIIAVVTCTI